jgi:tetratricopeptide (TPR) repeat protein
LIQEADSARDAGQTASAAEKYTTAQTELTRLQRDDPTWNPRVIRFRQNYLRERIAELTPVATPPAAAPAAAEPPTPAPASPNASTPQPPSVERENELQNLGDEIRRLHAEKQLLEAKLKEALTAQPAALDPRELEKAVERLRALEKENELLRVNLQRESQAAAKAVAPEVLAQARGELANAQASLNAQASTNQVLRSENRHLKEHVETLHARAKELAEETQAARKLLASYSSENQVHQIGSVEIERLRSAELELAAARTNLQAQIEANTALKLEVERLVSRVAVLEAAPVSAPAPLAVPAPEPDAAPSVAAAALAVEAVPAPETIALAQHLREAQGRAAEQTERLEALIVEREQLRQQLRAGPTSSQMAVLELENAALRRDLEAARKNARTSGRQAALRRELRDLGQALSEQKSANAKLRNENADLQKRLTRAVAEVQAAAERNQAEWRHKVRALETERDRLQAAVESSKQAPAATASATPRAREARRLNRQVRELEARVRVLEARKTPYTAEELALFQEPIHKPPPPVQVVTQATNTKSPPVRNDAEPAAPEAKKKSLKDLPPGAGPLVMEAQRAFAARRFAEAEQKYLQVLKLDENNAFTLGNLAAIRMEMNRLDDAEQDLKRALAAAPDDAFSLSLMGILRFRQQRFDDALTVLSRAAELDPANSETQNYLGITLSQQGQRDAAEAALRKAIRLTPGYGGAHYNLAVIYATQKPPFLALARLHYDKAITGGHPKNLQMEAVLNGAAPPPGVSLGNP